MTPWKLTVRRPVLTIVLFLVVAIFGLYGYRQLPIRENPDVDFPIVSIDVVLPGAEPEVVETEIIEPLEEEVNTVEGLKELRSTASEQVGTITAEFELWRDIDIAAQDVRDRIDRARRDLPEDAEAPIIQKIDPDAQAIMWIALTGDDRWDPVRMTRYADETLTDRLAGLRGVGRVQIGGERLYAVRIRMDPEKMASRGVTVMDVVSAVQSENLDIPTGRIESQAREFLVKTQGQFSSPEPLNDIIIRETGGAVVRLGDIGEAVEGVENERQLARFAEEQSVGLGIVKQSGANTVALAERVRSQMEEIAEDFPPGLSYTIASDDSTYIAESVRDLVYTIFIATILVFVVVLLFLRTFSGTFITTLAIPTSLMAGFAAAYALDFTLNNLTLLGLILAIGIVVDDAIVVLESAYRLQEEEGLDPEEAALRGTSIVAFPTIANTLSLAAVFIPVAFTQGIIGRFFFEFALIVAVSVAASTFTALTLTPMLCAKLLRISGRPNRFLRATRRAIDETGAFYMWTLKRALAYRFLALLVIAGLLAGGYFCFTQLSTTFLPDVDRSEFIISFETPEGSTLDYTDQYAKAIERVLDETAEVRHQFLAIGLAQGAGPGKANEGFSFVKLVPEREREKSQSEVMQDIRGKLADIPLGAAYVLSPGVAGIQNADLTIVLQNQDLMELARQKNEIITWMRGQPEYVGVNSDYKLDKPQVRVALNRDKAGQLGVDFAEISNTLRYLLGEPTISEIEQGSERYEVITEIASDRAQTPSIINTIYVRTNSGQLTPLGNLVTLEEILGPSQISHFNRQRSASIDASTPPGVVLGDALNKLESEFLADLPDGVNYTFAGQAQTFQDSFYYLTVALAFSIVFVYLVLSAQFESFLYPLLILLALPLAGVGAFFALWILDMPFSIYAFIGLIMLTGMATKNGILLIDYSLSQRREGTGIFDAARRGSEVRFRPVIMTTVSTVLGVMPIALGFGAGGTARAALGVTVASGLLVTTFLTLIVLPVGFTFVEAARSRVTSWREKRRERREKSAENQAAAQ